MKVVRQKRKCSERKLRNKARRKRIIPTLESRNLPGIQTLYSICLGSCTWGNHLLATQTLGEQSIPTHNLHSAAEIQTFVF